MDRQNHATEDDIKKEQHALLYDRLIDDGCNLYRGYKIIHGHLGTHITKSIAQDMMVMKLLQCKRIMKIYHEISSEKYVSKKIDLRSEYLLTEMFALESNYADVLNHIYANTNVQIKQHQVMELINYENMILFKLLYLQRLLGINWKANDK